MNLHHYHQHRHPDKTKILIVQDEKQSDLFTPPSLDAQILLSFIHFENFGDFEYWAWQSSNFTTSNAIERFQTITIEVGNKDIFS